MSRNSNNSQYIQCPYCDFVDKNTEEYEISSYSSVIVECVNCGKEFSLTCERDVRYYSRKIKVNENDR